MMPLYRINLPLLLALAPALVLVACAHSPPDLDSVAARHGFVTSQRSGTGWEHAVVEHLDAKRTDSTLHIYIEGDGTPWRNGRVPAQDPTPRRMLALELMAHDPAPGVYIGRPCYFGQAASANCNNALWTSERYSAAVVASMRRVIDGYLEQLAPTEVVLIGYSGGGALAALLAADLGPEVALVTVAGNLDTNLWTTLRGFLPLTGSLNPKDQAALLATQRQLHLVGERDSTVPAAVTQSFTGALGLPREPLREYPGFDHSCCWLQVWPEVLVEAPWQ